MTLTYIFDHILKLSQQLNINVNKSFLKFGFRIVILSRGFWGKSYPKFWPQPIFSMISLKRAYIFQWNFHSYLISKEIDFTKSLVSESSFKSWIWGKKLCKITLNFDPDPYFQQCLGNWLIDLVKIFTASYLILIWID